MLTSLVRPTLEDGAAYWDPCTGQKNTLDRVQIKVLILLIMWRILNGKTWLRVGRLHAYAHFLMRFLGNGFGKLCATGCEGELFE